MADIEYVIPGQAVRAGTINSIIDSLGGPYTPASEPDIGFQRTPCGSIFTSQTNVEGAPAYVAPQFLDVAWGTPLSGHQELMVNLGRDLPTALKLLPGDPVSVFFRDFSGSSVSKGGMLALSAESFQPNGAGKYFDGWVGTGIYSLEKASGGESGDQQPAAGETGAAALDGCLYMYDMQGDGGNACVIANSNSYKPFESDLKSITGWKSVSMKSKTAIATQTSASLKSGTASAGASLIRIHNAAPETETENYLFKLRANVETREEGGSMQKRAVIEYWDNSDTTRGGVKWNTYEFKSQSSQAGGAHWQQLSATEWAESIPEFDLTAWLKVSAIGDSTPELTSDYITNGEWVVTLEKKDDETCYIGGLAKGGIGTRQVVAYYPIGRVHNHSLEGHDSMFVEQCMLGSLNTLDMSWGGEGGGGGSMGDDSQRFTADSLLSSAEMSSVTRDAYTYKYAEELSTGEIEYKEATGYYFSLFNFKHAEGAIDLSLALSNDYKLPDRYKILVRDNQEKLGQQTKPVLKYATLSVEVPAMSVDSRMSSTNSWSVQLSAEDKGHGIVQLFNFTKEQEDGTYTFDKKNSSLSNDNLILARVKGDDGYKLKYMKLEVNGLSDVIPLSNMVFDLSANVQADTKVVEAKTKSVDKGQYTATVNHIDLSGNVKQEQVDATYFKLYNFESDEAIDKDSLTSLNDYTVLVKKSAEGSKELHYMALSSFRDLSVDMQDQQLNQKSIEKVQNGKMLQLYKFNQSSNMKISLDKDHTSTEDCLEVLVRSTKDGVKQLDYASLSIAFPDGRDLSADTEVASSGTKSVDCNLSVLSLHNFKGSSNDINLKIKDGEGNNKTPAGVSLLVREGNELKYADLQVTFPKPSDPSQKSQLSGMFKADAASGKGLSSVSEMWDGNTKIFSAYKFNDNEYHVADKKDAGANADVLVRDRDSKVLKYVDLSSFTGDISCDSDSLYSEKFAEKRASLEKAGDGLYQLYGFDVAGSTATVTLTPAQPKLSDDWQLVTRHKQGDTTNLVYADLSVAYHKGDGASVQEDQQDKSKLQLLDWASHSTVALKKVDGVAYEALVKDVNTGKLAYASLDISSSGSTYVDSEKSSVARSLEKVVPENGDPYLMVNGFDTAQNVQKSDLSTYQDDYDVLLRHRNGGLVEMSYASLKDIQLSGATAGEMNYNWMWKKDAEGNYVKPGAGSMFGYYLYGNVMRYVSKTIPAGSGFLHLVITYGTPSTTVGGSSPASENFQWKESYYTSPSLTSISIPLWYHDGTNPKIDMRAGLFTVPVYA